MKKRLSKDEAVGILISDEYARWTLLGALALVEYLEELEEDCGEEIEFDRVAIRCDYHEYKSALDAVEGYRFDGEKTEAAALEWLQDRTTVIPFEGGVVVGAF